MNSPIQFRSKTGFLITALLLTLTMAACAGGEALEGNGAQATAQQQPQKPTNATATAKEPTATPEPTETPPASLCDNTYYPVVVGATHTYLGAGTNVGEFVFTETITEVRSDGFTVSTQFDELVLVQEWECTDKGLVMLQYGGGAAASVATSGMETVYETTDVSGVTLPANVAVGDTWSQAFTVSGSMDLGEAGSAVVEGMVTVDFEAVAIEVVQTAKGTFTSLRVESQLEMAMTVTLQELTIPSVLNANTVTWYGQGIGWIGSEETSTMEGLGSFETTINLQSYSLP
jgi:hypothetical protein